MRSKKPPTFSPLEVGELCYGLITEQAGKDRWNVLETATVQVAEPATADNGGAMVKVTILRASRDWYAGRKMEMRRCDLYRKADPEQVRLFGEQVRMMWQPRRP
jgi:hypothetical protein